MNPDSPALTPAERRILRLIARGDTSKEIAGQLCVHYRTVENHRFNIAQKLGLNGHNAVLKFALTDTEASCNEPEQLYTGNLWGSPQAAT